MKIHHVLLNEFNGQDVLETLCGRVVTRVRDENLKTVRFRTEACDNFNISHVPRDVSCNTCQHVWRNIGPHR